MATSKEIQDKIDLAKAQIVNNTSISDEFKSTYFQLLNTALIATNGISPEEKIQKITDCIALLASTQTMFICTIDKRINDTIKEANNKQCNECKALKHANEVEDEKRKEQWIKEYKQKMGISDDDQNEEDGSSKSWSDIIKTMLTKPYIYVTLCVMAMFPYGVQITDKIISLFSK